MGTIRLTLTHEIKKNGEDFHGGTNYWAGLGTDHLAQMVSMAVEVENSVKKWASKGGPLTVSLVADIQGVEMPPELQGPRNYSGLTLHGVNKVEDEMQKLGARLVKMGKDHADKKEGPKP